MSVLAYGEAGELNESLRRALLRARLREDDVAALLGVDPKTVRRWLDGRVPYASNRAALADLVGADEADLWPDASGPLGVRVRPEELEAVYSHRCSIPRGIWKRFFEGADREIGILAYSALFLAEEAGILRILADRGRTGVTIRIALADPDSPHLPERSDVEDVDEDTPAEIRNAIEMFSPLATAENIEIRLHRTLLYGSIYRADDQLFVNQHVYGIPASHTPVFSFHRCEDADITAAYIASFEHVWQTATPL